MKMQPENQIFSFQDLKDSKKIKYQLTQLAPTLLGLFLCLGFLFFTPKYDSEQTTHREIFKILEKNYVDEIQIPEKKDSQSIQEWLKTFDPHTYYLAPQKAKKVKNELKGKMEGIGIYVQYSTDSAMVFFVNPNSPAAKAGILPGDIILAVDELKTSEILKSDTLQFSDLIRGADGTQVRLDIFRPFKNECYTKIVTRTFINISSTSDVFLMKNGIGFVRLELFSSNSYQQLVDSIKQLKSSGMKQLILDLRDNGGGLLDQAIKIANEFLEKGQMITFTKGAHRTTQNYKANGEGQFKELPLYILVNENSASASEVLAAALKENNRATLIGENTYGKGLVQETYQLNNGGSLNITIARYFTPDGSCIQKPYTYKKEESNTKYGIEPDYFIKASRTPFPSYREFDAARSDLFKQHWLGTYPNASKFATEFLYDSISIAKNLALGIMIYGPNELPNLLLTHDNLIQQTVKLIRTSN